MPNYFLLIQHPGLGREPRLFCRVDDLSQEEIRALVKAVEGQLKLSKVRRKQADKLPRVQYLQLQNLWEERGSWLPRPTLHNFVEGRSWVTEYLGRAHDTALNMAANLRRMRQESSISKRRPSTEPSEPRGKGTGERGGADQLIQPATPPAPASEGDANNNSSAKGTPDSTGATIPPLALIHKAILWLFRDLDLALQAKEIVENLKNEDDSNKLPKSRTKVSEVLRELVDWGYVKKVERSSKYQITLSGLKRAPAVKPF